MQMQTLKRVSQIVKKQNKRKHWINGVIQCNQYNAKFELLYSQEMKSYKKYSCHNNGNGRSQITLVFEGKEQQQSKTRKHDAEVSRVWKRKWQMEAKHYHSNYCHGEGLEWGEVSFACVTGAVSWEQQAPNRALRRGWPRKGRCLLGH